jgi:hypothetical protein
VERWARDVWASWAAFHGTIESWLAAGGPR